MSQNQLTGIFGLLPAQDQQDALLHGIEGVFARGEWELCEELCEHILQTQADAGLKARALLQAIKAALRLRKVDTAFERLQLLAEVEGDSSGALAEAFFQMAAQMLPENASMLAGLWERCCQEAIKKDSCQLWSRAGVLLAQSLAKSGDKARAAKISTLLAASMSR